MARLDFKKKSFIIFIIFDIISHIIFLSLNDFPSTLSGKVSLFFSYPSILFYVLYTLSIVFLFLGRWYAWILGSIPSLYQITLSIPDLLLGNANGDTALMALRGIYLILPLIVIVYCLINLIIDLKKLEGKKLDFILGILFLILTSIFLSDLFPSFFKGYLMLQYKIVIVFIFAYYITIVLWALIEYFVIKHK